MPIIIDPDDLNQGTEVTINTGTRTIDLNEAGNLDSSGVTLQALYSFLKEEWKTDATKIMYPFPMVAITPEQFEFIENWRPYDDAARKLIRTGGWREINDESVIEKEYAGIVTLGSFEDTVNDNAYYQQGDDPTDTTAGIDFTYAGPVNEAIKTYDLNVPPDPTTGFDFEVDAGFPDYITRNDGGSFVTDGFRIGGQVTVINATTSANNGTYTILDVGATYLDIPEGSITADTGDQTVEFALNHRGALNLFLRVRDADPYGKSFAQSNLTAIGVSALDNKVFRFPLSNATDLKIEETDANVGSNSPYTSIDVKYFGQAFSREVDTTTARDFGIVIDVGTQSGVYGASAGTTVFTAGDGNLSTDEYAGGTLTIHEGTDKGVHSIVSNTPTNFTLTAALTGSETNLSYTAQLASPVVATAEEIYEKIQYLLRQASDIDATDAIVTGKTADSLLTFVGDTLTAGVSIPSNPNGGGSGVIIEGFDSNDTNRLVFYDNTETDRTYPFVAAGTINFNANLVSDAGPAEYWMFFSYTRRTNVTDLVITGTTDVISSSGANLPSTVGAGDYVTVSGLTGEDEPMNGVYLVGGTPTTSAWDVSRYDGETIVTTTSAAADIDENPLDSPDAIIVDNNSGVDITGTIGAASVGFDFDYDGNSQGGRTPGSDAEITLRAIGHNLAQFVQTTGTITRATGLTFSLVSALERNYDNP